MCNLKVCLNGSLPVLRHLNNHLDCSLASTLVSASCSEENGFSLRSPILALFSGKRRGCRKPALLPCGARGLPGPLRVRSCARFSLGAPLPGAARPPRWSERLLPSVPAGERRGWRQLRAPCGKHGLPSCGENRETLVWGAPGSDGACLRDGRATSENTMLPGS